MRSGSEIRSRGSVVIHPTAIVDPEAELADGVEVGPYAIISGTVKIGPRTVVGPRVTIEGYTSIGADNEIFTGAVVGSRTQDKKFDGGVSYLKIGDRNKIREYVTLNPGTKDGTETLVGNDNLFMAYCHIAHDCIVKNKTVLANSATLAGHVVIDDGAIIGGLTGIHQFVHIGQMAIIGGCSKVVQDVPPFVMADGHPARAYGLNSVGLDRNAYSKEDKALLKKAYKIIFRSELSLKSAIAQLEAELPQDNSAIQTLLNFLRNAPRGICD